MTTIAASGELHRLAREHLRGRVEQVGFFLADFDAGGPVFVLREWRSMPPEAFTFQSAYHLTLRDEIRPELIKWAWDHDACLVEAHSHVDGGSAAFSASDLRGFAEWVPHVRWRLRGRPYAAIVTAADSFDALAWLDASGTPDQVARLAVDDAIYAATGQTLLRSSELKERRHGE